MKQLLSLKSLKLIATFLDFAGILTLLLHLSLKSPKNVKETLNIILVTSDINWRHDLYWVAFKTLPTKSKIRLKGPVKLYRLPRQDFGKNNLPEFFFSKKSVRPTPLIFSKKVFDPPVDGPGPDTRYILTRPWTVGREYCEKPHISVFNKMKGTPEKQTELHWIKLRFQP